MRCEGAVDLCRDMSGINGVFDEAPCSRLPVFSQTTLCGFSRHRT